MARKKTSAKKRGASRRKARETRKKRVVQAKKRVSKKLAKSKAKPKKRASAKRKKTAKAAQKPSSDLFENVHRTRIRVVGVGGGGGSIVAEIAAPLQKFDFFAANTDMQALRQLPKKVRSFSFGQDLTQGLGCGMDAELGERAAKAEKDKIKRLLEGSDVCVLIASLGGGTGSGAAPTFAEVSQGLRCLTIGIFTMPFAFEGDRRRQIAETALEKLKHSVNAYVVIPNESIFQVIDEKTPLRAALSAVNKRLANTLEGFMEMLSLPGLINIDFADVRSILEGRGKLAFTNSVEAGGPARAQEVLQGVLVHPLYEYGMGGADRVLFHITGDRNLKMQEVAQISRAISEHNAKARIIFGISCNSRMKERVKVTLFAVGCDAGEKKAGKEGKEERSAAGRKRISRKGPEKRKRRGISRKSKQEEETKEPAEPQETGAANKEEAARVRRNALDVKKAVDEEMKELEQKEKQWDIPAFLRNK